jgi:hypothetical protein
MTVAEILIKVSRVLNDEDFVRWSIEELIGWLNDGLAAVVKAKPTANTVVAPMRLEQGTLQHLPSVALHLIRITRNLADNRPDARLGRKAITAVDRAELDAVRPNWHDQNITPYRDDVRHVVYEEASPRTFYVYPGNSGLGTVEAIYSVLPDAIVHMPAPATVHSYTMPTGLGPEYSDTLQHYMLWRAHSKDAPYAEAQMAQFYLQLVGADLGSQFQVQSVANPNRKSPSGPANP